MSTAWNGLRGLWLGLFALTACLLLYAVTQRLYYPYPLEWLEAASVDMAERLLAGLPIFSAPSIAYVAPMKTPLYYYLMAAVWPLVGNGFVAGRLISILATLGTLGLIWHFVRSEGGSRIWALFGIAFYMATFQIGGQWYDIARLDAAFLFFAMAGLYGLRFWRGSLGTAGAGVLLAAAFFTKQRSSWWRCRCGSRSRSKHRGVPSSPASFSEESSRAGWFCWMFSAAAGRRISWSRFQDTAPSIGQWGTLSTCC